MNWEREISRRCTCNEIGSFLSYEDVNELEVRLYSLHELYIILVMSTSPYLSSYIIRPHLITLHKKASLRAHHHHHRLDRPLLTETVYVSISVPSSSRSSILIAVVGAWFSWRSRCHRKTGVLGISVFCLGIWCPTVRLSLCT